jgi:PleD family two-component response regulator
MLTAKGEHEAGLEAMDAGAVDCLARQQIEAPPLERSVRHAIHYKRTEERFHSLMQNASDIMLPRRCACLSNESNESMLLL